MKIGFFSPYLDTFGGGERYILTLASHLSKNHSVDIFWDNSTIKAPLTRFLKIDAKTKLNLTRYKVLLACAYFTRNLFAQVVIDSSGAIYAPVDVFSLK